MASHSACLKVLMTDCYLVLDLVYLMVAYLEKLKVSKMAYWMVHHLFENLIYVRLSNHQPTNSVWYHYCDQMVDALFVSLSR